MASEPLVVASDAMLGARNAKRVNRAPYCFQRGVRPRLNSKHETRSKSAKARFMAQPDSPAVPFGFAEPSSTSLSLLERVHLGDAEAWRRLVKLYGPMVYRWGRGAGLRAQEAEDLVQEVFFSVSQHVATFRHDRPGDCFRAWLATIARTKVCDYIRRGGNRGTAVGGTAAQERLLQVAEESISTSDPPGAEDSPWHGALGMVQAEFEDRTWRAFWRVVVDGQPPAAVADELGMTAAAVYKAKSRVLNRVRRELHGLESPE